MLDANPEENARKRNEVEQVIEKVKLHSQPRRNAAFEWHRFWSRDQAEGESIDQWIHQPARALPYRRYQALKRASGVSAIIRQALGSITKVLVGIGGGCKAPSGTTV